jgi:uncharacterized membrane protein YuzA (DUF378 family)
MAPKSDVLLYTVIGICIVYLAVLLFFILRTVKGKKKQDETK